MEDQACHWSKESHDNIGWSMILQFSDRHMSVFLIHLRDELYAFQISPYSRKPLILL